MKEGSWQDCMETSSALAISPDNAKARSLIETAKGRIAFVQSIPALREDNANYIFENYYSSIVELIHALVLQKGYKVNNHICLGFYLRDVLENQELFRLFDDCRFKRNSLVYYGKKMDFKAAGETIHKSKRLIKKLEGLA